MHILPYADILAWCLMPNHFHLIVLVNHLEVVTESKAYSSDDSKSSDEFKPRTLNNSMAILLRSYTRAINKQNNTSGTLFRQKTKAECLTMTNNITPAFIHSNQGTIINAEAPSEQYPQICFNYIHQNPVKAGIVLTEAEYEFSSAKDYAGLRSGTLVNKEIAKQYGLQKLIG